MKAGRARRITLAFKLSFLILLAALLILIGTILFNTYSTQKIILKIIEHRFLQQTAATANEIEEQLRSIEVAPNNVSGLLERGVIQKKELLDLIRNTVSTSYYMYGSAIAYEPGAFDTSTVYFSPYFHKVGSDRSDIAFFYITGPSYDYFKSDWYKEPKTLGKAVWTEPYMGEVVRELMTTYSVPFYQNREGQRQFTGVVTADLTLNQIIHIVKRVKLYESGHAFLLSRKGVFLSHPNIKIRENRTIFSVAAKDTDPKLEEVARKMIQGETGDAVLDWYFNWEKSWIFYAPIYNGWSIAVVVPERELFSQFNQLLQRQVLVSILVFALLLGAVVLISKKITVPLGMLANKAKEIAKGNLDVEISKTTSTDEVADLSVAFEEMRVSLKEYIKNLESTTAANARFENELKIGRNIQMSFLPKSFPERKELELHAFLNPAKEVGGDLYDFFIAENGKLFFLVGDVSDKGVPAALFMSAVTTLMRGFSHREDDPAAVLHRVNRELCIYNEAMMFVTLFCGLLDLRNGELTYCNAGHNPPILMRHGEAQYMRPDPGFVLGVDPSFSYHSDTLFFDPGDLIVVYSDGVTEAMNPDKTVFSEEKLLEVVVNAKDSPTTHLVERITQAVTNHAAGSPQSDDITVLALRYRGGETIG